MLLWCNNQFLCHQSLGWHIRKFSLRVITIKSTLFTCDDPEERRLEVACSSSLQMSTHCCFWSAIRILRTNLAVIQWMPNLPVIYMTCPVWHKFSWILISYWILAMISSYIVELMGSLSLSVNVWSETSTPFKHPYSHPFFPKH